MPEKGISLTAQKPLQPPSVDDSSFLEEPSHGHECDAYAALVFRDEKLFARLEDWLARLEVSMDKMTSRKVISPNFSLHSEGSVQYVESQEQRASLVMEKLEETRAIKEHAEERHRELQVALGQTKGMDRDKTPWRVILLDRLTACVQRWVSYASLQLKPDDPNSPVEDEDFQHAKEVHVPLWRRMLRAVVQSWMFEAFFAVVILTNSAVIAMQVEDLARNPGATPSDASFLITSVYTFLFTMELLLRILAGGFAIFCGAEWSWHVLDFLVVSSSIFEFALEVALQEAGDGNGNVFTNMRLLRILRIGRITRAIRIVRLVKFIRSLRSLLYSIGHTLRAMVWSVVLLALIIFLFGLIFTDITSEYLARDAHERTEVTEGFLKSRFGGLQASMHTLYASITGGLTWIEARDALAEISDIWGFLFEAYIAFCLFAVLNVMTGVFCQSAMDSAEKDHELVLQNVVQEKAKYFRAVRRLFTQLDKNADGDVTAAEFELAINDPSLRSVFDALEINAADAWALFQQLDSDGNHHVDVDEFLEGCMLLKGPARSIDVVCIKRDVAGLRMRIDNQGLELGKLSKNLQKLCDALNPASRGKTARENCPS
ncbi:unnamed protein product [Effrenium voratum]|nr:unnamed protein product [Effrenium voratum]